MRKLTSVTVWTDAVGKRMSVTYSEIDDGTGQIVADNKRKDKVVVDADGISAAETMMAYAQDFVNGL